MKPLYRSVALDLGSANDSRLSAFLQPSNIGLKHIKKIRLYLVKPGDRCCDREQQAQLMSRMILGFLPDDILEEFRYAKIDRYKEHARSVTRYGCTDEGHSSWCPWKPFSADNLLLLYRRQRNLKWVELMDLDRDVLPDLKKNEKKYPGAFQQARRLALYPENRETLRLSQFFVQKTADALEELVVHANFYDPSGSARRDSSTHGEYIEARELNDSATAPGLLSSTIFSHMMPFEKCEPFKNLTSLRLHRINLRYCADTWCKVINFPQIESLRLFHCSGSDTLLGKLCKSNRIPRKLRSLEFPHQANTENDALLALDGFLCLVSGIQDLVIDVEQAKSMPAPEGIVRHSKTLKMLNVHCMQETSSSGISSSSDDGELVWDGEDFEKICKACTLIQQLSCAWPQTSLIRAPSEEWREFERASSNLHEIVTLHISTWPTNKPSTQLLPRTIYEHLLQCLAQRSFEIAVSRPYSSSLRDETGDDDDEEAETAPAAEKPPASKLRLVAFGNSEKIFDREDSKNQIIYLKSTCIDSEGKSKVYAAPVSWTLRQYVETRSEVLDFELTREARPPCRDTGRDGAGFGWGGGDDDE